MEGLAKAARDWDPARRHDRSFWSFAATKIIGEMRDELRRIDHLTRNQRAAVIEREDGTLAIEEMAWLDPQEPMPLDAQVKTPDGDQRASLASLIPDPRDAYASADNRDALTRALAVLTDRERDALVGVDYVGVGNSEVASQMGFTQGRASQIRAEAAAKMRRALGADFLLAA